MVSIPAKNSASEQTTQTGRGIIIFTMRYECNPHFLALFLYVVICCWLVHVVATIIIHSAKNSNCECIFYRANCSCQVGRLRFCCSVCVLFVSRRQHKITCFFLGNMKRRRDGGHNNYNLQLLLVVRV